MPVKAPQIAIRASARRSRLRTAFCGPSKSGKTFNALVTATKLVEVLREHGKLRRNGRIVVIDSEDERGHDYGDVFDYDVMSLFSKSPEAYIDFIDMATKANYEVIIIDQISDEWAGEGGILEITNAVTQQSVSKNSYFAFQYTTPRHNRFISAITSCPAHMICNMRVKTDYVLETNDRGGIVPRKIGLKPIARDSTEYEFDIVATIDLDHKVKIETRGMLSELLGNDRILNPGKPGQIRDAGEITQIGEYFANWICGLTIADENSISREQQNEIYSYGEKLGWTYDVWKKFLSRYNISSISMLTPEQYEHEKPLLLRAIAARSENGNTDNQMV